MSTARSSVERTRAHKWRRYATRSVVDAVALVRFRGSLLRGRSRRLAAGGFAAIALLTVVAGWLPAYLPDSQRRTDTLSLLPSAMVGILVISVISAAASGGGRELLPREQAVSFPITPATDHFGALLLAPLNIAWLLQSWLLMAAVAYVAGPGIGLLASQLIVVSWLGTATALAQVVGWCLEWVRRGPHGTVAARLVTGAAAVAVGYLLAADTLVPLLESSPTLQVTIAALSGRSGINGYYLATLASLAVVSLVAVVVGVVLAGAVHRRPPREELRLESSRHPARTSPPSDLRALLRLDRAGIWRSVPLRRGLVVLTLMPGLVAVAGALQWPMLTVLPGLVASGGALLFGVNSWALDGRGVLWRDSLPVDPRLVFASRGLVLVEVLAVATAATLALAAVRAGVPTRSQLAAVVSCASVVVAQVVSASMRWSVRRPFAVDLRSARATPAPPLVMVGYSARLALGTTLVGLVFSLLSYLTWGWSVLVAGVMVLFSAWRLAQVANEWARPARRSLVVTTVAS